MFALFAWATNFRPINIVFSIMRNRLDINRDTKIAETLSGNPFVLLMLEHFGIGIPVQESKVSQLCATHNINESLFIAFAKLYNGSTFIPDLKLSSKDALDIIRFLGRSHRFYSEEIYPEIMGLIDRMVKLNSDKESRLVSLFFADYFKEVTEHLNYENQVFHPYVSRLVSQLEGIDYTNDVDYSAAQYKEHHSDIEEKLRDLKNLLIKYLPIHDDQVVRRKLLFLLSELEMDLKIHSDIEDLILTPLVLRLEKDLKRTKQ